MKIPTNLPAYVCPLWSVICREIGGVKMCQRPVSITYHRLVLTVVVDVHKAWDEVGRQGNDECLEAMTDTYVVLYHTVQGYTL